MSHSIRLKDKTSKKSLTRASRRHFGRLGVQFHFGGVGRRLCKFRQTRVWFCWMRQKHNGGLLNLQRHWIVGHRSWVKDKMSEVV